MLFFTGKDSEQQTGLVKDQFFKFIRFFTKDTCLLLDRIQYPVVYLLAQGLSQGLTHVLAMEQYSTQQKNIAMELLNLLTIKFYQMNQLTLKAGGTLSNAPPPESLSSKSKNKRVTLICSVCKYDLPALGKHF